MGNQTLTATDVFNTSLTVTSGPIAVSPSTATQLVLSAPAAAIAGTSFTFTITAKDLYGNTATGYAGTVHFTSSDSQASLPADTTLTNGVGTFSARLVKAGPQSITATDTVTRSLTGISNVLR